MCRDVRQDDNAFWPSDQKLQPRFEFCRSLSNHDEVSSSAFEVSSVALNRAIPLIEFF